MRIVWWTPGFPPDLGGIERLAELVLPEFVRHGTDVLVVANTADTEISEGEHLGVPFVRLPSRRALATRDLQLLATTKQRVVDIKEQFRPDVVHVHLSDPSVHFHLTTPTPNVRTVVTIHSEFTADGADTLFGRAVENADAITGVRASILPDHVRELAARDGRIVAVTPNAIAIGKNPAAPTYPPVVLAVGRLTAVKGFDTLLQAYAQTRAQAHAIPLRIVGDGEERAPLQRLAKTLAIDVDFAGALPPEGVAEEYRRASLVVMPSRREGQPFVAMEAAAAGRAIVGSRIPGLADVVVDGTTGTLVPVDDPGAFAAALDDLLDDPERIARYGAAARAQAVAEFSLDLCVERYLALYRAVLEREVLQ